MLVAGALLAIILFQALPLIAWLRVDRAPPGWDSAWHAMLALDHYDHLSGRAPLAVDRELEIFPLFAFARGYYPPLVHRLATPFHAALGRGYHAAVASNLFFLALLVVSAYAIGRNLHGRAAGLMLAFVSSSVPQYAALARQFLLDFPLAAMTAFGAAALLHLYEKPGRARAVAAGVALGLGMLTKQTYFIWLLAPTAAMLVFLARECPRGTVEWRVPALFVLSALAVTALWYSPNRLGGLSSAYVFNAVDQGAIEGDPSVLSWNGFTYYARLAWSELSPPYCAAALAGLGCLVTQRKPGPWTIAGLALACGLGVFTLLPNKDPRYLAPAHVAITIVMVLGVFSIERPRLRRTVVGLILVVGLLQSWLGNVPPFRRAIKLGPLTVLQGTGRMPRTPGVDPAEVLRAIADDAAGRAFSVCVISDNWRVNFMNVAWAAFETRVPITRLAGSDECDPLDYDYVVLGSHFRNGFTPRSRLVFDAHRQTFTPIFQFEDVAIHRRRRSDESAPSGL